MSYYARNHHEDPEPPRCPECDECMTEVTRSMGHYWECRNPECEACPEKYKPEPEKETA